jgi:hypothetical protein
MALVIKGVHEVEAPEPCWLLEVEVDDSDFDWGQVTQEADGQPRDNWQVPWDERPLDSDEHRWAFFFHYLDLKKPLLTSDGPVNLPKPSPRPAHLKEIQYEEP